MSVHFSERLTTENTEVITGKVGTHATRRLYVHEDDFPLHEGTHFRYLGGFHTQEPTEHGFYPEYGKITEIHENGAVKYYHVSVDGSPRNVEAVNIPAELAGGVE